MIDVFAWQGPLAKLWMKIPDQYTNHVIVGILVLAFFLLLIAKFFSRFVITFVS